MGIYGKEKRLKLGVELISTKYHSHRHIEDEGHSVPGRKVTWNDDVCDLQKDETTKRFTQI